MINPGDEKTTEDGRVWVAEEATDGCDGCDASEKSVKWCERNMKCIPEETGGKLLIWKIKTTDK